MAHQWLRCNLAAQLFPLMTDLWGRSIIVPQYDENYERVTVSPADLGKDKGVPQVYYLHNCMPTSTGFQAIGYDQAVNPVGGGITTFDKAFSIYNPNLNRAQFVPALGANYFLENSTTGWVSVNPFTPGIVTASTVITTAFVQSQTYICYSTLGVYIYDPTAMTLTKQTLIGLADADVRGICGANGYMIAYTENAVAWSSQTNPLDFTPSLVTGAGGGNVEDAKGVIIACLPIANGFIVYCELNAVGAKYTGNNEFPYNIIEIPGSGGISAPEVVSWQGNSDTHFAWTDQGLQTLSLVGDATNIFPEVTEFLSGKVYEDFDETALAWNVNYLVAPLNIKIAVISNQYLVISYGVVGTIPEFTYALVYDLNRQRFGKLKIDHVCAFQWVSPGNNIDLRYEDLVGGYDAYLGHTYEGLGEFPLDVDGPQVAETLSFLQADGTIYRVNFDLGETEASGVLMLGKYQVQRNVGVTHQRTDVENVRDSATNFNMYVIPTTDGKTLGTPQIATALNTNPNVRRYAKRVWGVNYSLLFIGAFNMVSVETDLEPGMDI